MTVLTNHEKAVIIDAINDKYSELSIRIEELFNVNDKRYGYRRIHGLLSKENGQVG